MPKSNPTNPKPRLTADARQILDDLLALAVRHEIELDDIRHLLVASRMETDSEDDPDLFDHELTLGGAVEWYLKESDLSYTCTGVGAWLYDLDAESREV